jgi:hypothetical protein
MARCQWKAIGNRPFIGASHKAGDGIKTTGYFVRIQNQLNSYEFSYVWLFVAMNQQQSAGSAPTGLSSIE